MNLQEHQDLFPESENSNENKHNRQGGLQKGYELLSHNRLNPNISYSKIQHKGQCSQNYNSANSCYNSANCY